MSSIERMTVDGDTDRQGSGFSLATRVVLAAVSTIFSFFIVGLGQFYNEKWLRGCIYAAGSFFLWFLLLGAAYHVYMFDLHLFLFL